MTEPDEHTGALPRLAVLIDADNVHPAIVETLLAEIARLGVASVKRIYGDWTKPDLAAWKEALLQHAIQPIQQFGYTSGKNATDCMLIIDAMDLLYTRRFHGFCLVSSDSDFTRLAARLREEGLTVYGFGEHKTPAAFVSACDRFTYIEAPLAERKQAASAPKGNDKNAKLMDLLRSAAETAINDDSGWANLGAVGSSLRKQDPNFDHRAYGCKTLLDLIAATGQFEIQKKPSDDGKTAAVSIRDRKQKKPK